MTEQVKMGDVFKLPMLCEDGDGFIYSKDCMHSIRFDDSDTNCMEQKIAVSNAINLYDQHVELTSKQEEQIKMLREALELIVKIAEFPPVDRAILQEANKALSATEQK